MWGIASKGNPSLSYISGTYSFLRAEGYVFPPITERIDSILLETAVVSTIELRQRINRTKSLNRHLNGLIPIVVSVAEHHLH